jgi:hypothetical protein
VGVLIGDVHALMPYPVCDCQSREAHLDQQRYMGVPQVVDSDALHPGFLGSPVHLVVQVALGHLKDPLVWLNFVEGFQVIPDLVRQKLRHLDDPDALGRFRVSDYIPAFQPLIGFGDGEQPLVQVEVCWGQSQQFALPDATPVEDLKSVIGLRLVHHRFRELEVLFLRSEEHLLVLF